MKNRFLHPTLISACILSFLAGYVFSEYDQVQLPSVAVDQDTIRACFSPEGHCETHVIGRINKSQKSIKVQAYAFTSRPITEALLEAQKRGVDVQVLCDKSQMKGKYSRVKALLQEGVPVYLDRVEGLSHNKVIILDDKWLLTGSYNWTRAANTKNAENLLFIDSPELATIYAENWDRRLQTATRVQ